ncbi:MAG: hypothetical protein COC15_02575 [Legionellales bacterium]|nr:MAG: hypothetical protein COC15_02575 [Legionellales bacterium]
MDGTYASLDFKQKEAIGGTCALGVASFVISHGFNWRSVFWFGAGIAIIGAAARTRMRETKNFADARHRVKKAMATNNTDIKVLRNNPIWNESFSRKTALSLFAIECAWPICFYFAYIYCGSLLKHSFNFTPEQVIQQNFIVSLVQLANWLLLIVLSYKIYPLKILKVKLIIFMSMVIFLPMILNNATAAWQVLLVQSFIVAFGFMGAPAISIFYKQIPIFKRFTYSTLIYALSRFTHIIAAFGFAYFSTYLGHWGILVLIIPAAIAFTYALRHFQEIDKVDFRDKFQSSPDILADPTLQST